MPNFTKYINIHNNIISNLYNMNYDQIQKYKGGFSPVNLALDVGLPLSQAIIHGIEGDQSVKPEERDYETQRQRFKKKQASLAKQKEQSDKEILKDYVPYGYKTGASPRPPPTASGIAGRGLYDTFSDGLRSAVGLQATHKKQLEDLQKEDLAADYEPEESSYYKNRANNPKAKSMEFQKRQLAYMKKHGLSSLDPSKVDYKDIIEGKGGEELDGGMNTLFGRMGGKRKLALRLISLFPKDYKVFVEPFVGAGNIFFRIKQEEGVKYVINDKDNSVIKIFKGVAKHPQTFVINSISKTEFDNRRDKNSRTAEDEFVILKYSFFSTGKSYTQPNTTLSKESQLKKLQDASKLLSNATILNEDFEKVIKKYDNPSTFFYLDPPYESETQKDYKDYVTPEQIYNVVSKIKGRFLLSYNSSPKIKQLFKEYNIKEIKTEYNLTKTIKNRAITELVIKNY
jgi:DNA adenine methylase